MIGHQHEWVMTDRHENENRIRDRWSCACGAVRYGCFAKRLLDGVEAWGPIQQWTYVVRLEASQ